MTKKLLPPERAASLLRLVVHFSVRMLSRFLDPWSRAGADILIEYVDSMWKAASSSAGRKPDGGDKTNPPSSRPIPRKRHSP